MKVGFHGSNRFAHAAFFELFAAAAKTGVVAPRQRLRNSIYFALLAKSYVDDENYRM